MCGDCPRYVDYSTLHEKCVHVELHSGYYRGRMIESGRHQLRITNLETTNLETTIGRNGEIR